jgi:hypothetical protein
MAWWNLIRWAALLSAVAVVVWLGPNAVRNYRDWREALVNDPSVADLYETNLWFDSAGIAAGLIVGSLIFFGLKQKQEPPRGRATAQYDK